MRTAMRPRYYCDHCNKGSGSPSAMKRHERGCTVNPNRVCGMCALEAQHGGEEPAPSTAGLRKIIDASGFKAMCEAAHDCPACILAVLRTLNRMDELAGPYVAGPDDGRSQWSYKQAKTEWWANFWADQNPSAGSPY